MNISKATELVRVERQIDSYDSLGQPSNAWQLVDGGEVWAQVSISGGSELVKSKRLFDTADAVFVIRHMDGITPKNRIVYDGENWNIIAVEKVGRRDSLRIVARRYNGI